MSSLIGERNDARPGLRRRPVLAVVSVSILCLGIAAPRVSATGAEQDDAPKSTEAADPSPAPDRAAIALEIVPFIAPSMVRTQFAPLASHLSEILDRRVEIVVLKSHRAVVDRAGIADERLVVAPRHLAAYLVGRRDYAAVAYFEAGTHPVVYIRTDLEWVSLDSLRGHRLSLPAPLSFHAVMALGLLRELGLRPERDVEVRYHTFHDSALFDVVERRSDAVVTAPAIVAMLTPELQGAVRSIATIPEPAGAVLVAGPALDPALQERLDAVYPPTEVERRPPRPVSGDAGALAGDAGLPAVAASGPSAGTVFEPIPPGELQSWPELARMVETALSTFAVREDLSPESPTLPSNGG